MVKNGIKVEREVISPTTAESMLEQSECAVAAHGLDPVNRSLRNSGVEKYARLMREGKWDECNPAPISVSPEGYVIDGQHRLYAIIESGVTLTLFVARDVPHKTQHVIDDGIRRKAGDFTGLSNRSAAIANCMVLSEMGKRSNAELVRFYEQHKEAIHFAELVGAAHTIGVTVAPVLAVIARAWYTQSRSRLLEFGEAIVSGRMRYPYDDAAITLRNFLMSDNRSRHERSGSGQRYDIYEKTQYCLRAFLDRRSARKALASTVEHFDIPS